MELLLFSDPNKEIIDESLTFLKDAGYEDASIRRAESESMYEIYIPEEQFDEARQELLDYLQSELEESALTTEDDPAAVKQKSYKDLSENYKEENSSAWMLVIFGIIGLIALGLEMAGVFTIPVASNIKPVFYLVMAAMFITFTVGGFLSFRTAARLKQEAESTSNLYEQLKYYASNDISPEQVDASITDLETMSEEERYFARAAYIRRAVSEAFSSTNPAYLDAMVEDVIHLLYDNK